MSAFICCICCSTSWAKVTGGIDFTLAQATSPLDGNFLILCDKGASCGPLYSDPNLTILSVKCIRGLSLAICSSNCLVSFLAASDTDCGCFSAESLIALFKSTAWRRRRIKRKTSSWWFLVRRSWAGISWTLTESPCVKKMLLISQLGGYIFTKKTFLHLFDTKELTFFAKNSNMTCKKQKKICNIIWKSQVIKSLIL